MKNVAKAGLAQPSENSPVGNRLAEMVGELLDHAVQHNLQVALDRLGSDFEHQINEAKAAALKETRDQIENHFKAFETRLEIRALDALNGTDQAMEKKSIESIEKIRQTLDLQQQDAAQTFSDNIRVRLMQMVVSEEDRMRQETSASIEAAVSALRESLTMEMAKFTERIRTRGEEMAALSTTRWNKQLEEATTRVHQSFMRHIVTELSGKQANFIEEAMKPLEAAAEQNLKRMRKELTRMVKEVGQRFVSGGETDE